MNCDEAKRLLEGALDVRTLIGQNDELASHTRRCQRCAHELRLIEMASRELARFEPAVPAPDVVGKVVRSLGSMEHRGLARRRLRRNMILELAMELAAMAATCTFLFWSYEAGVLDPLVEGAVSWLTMKYEGIARSISLERVGGTLMTLTIAAGLVAAAYLLSELTFLVFERRALSRDSHNN